MAAGREQTVQGGKQNSNPNAS